jgi:hypothetical protein
MSKGFQMLSDVEEQYASLKFCVKLGKTAVGM